jgi:hypothetical protein
MEIVIVLIAGAAIYWFFILRPGRLDFWRIVAKHPDAAYEHFKSDHCWRVFEEQLPENYRSLVPRSEWVGPFQFIVPKLGNKTMYIFGKHPTFEKSQNEFLGKFAKST